MRRIMVIIENIRYILKKNKKDNISAIAAQSAFFVMLSFVPMIMFVIAVISMFGGDYEQVRKISSEEFSGLTIYGFLSTALASAREGATGIAVTTLIIALWSAGKGMYAITDGISRIYGFDEKRPWFIRRVLSMGYTIVMLLLIVAMTVWLIVIRSLSDSLKAVSAKIPFGLEMLFGFRYLIAFVLMVLIITVSLKLYLRGRVEDKKYSKFRVLLPGAVFTTL